jgi:hypothetical protein
MIKGCSKCVWYLRKSIERFLGKSGKLDRSKSKGHGENFAQRVWDWNTFERVEEARW